MGKKNRKRACPAAGRTIEPYECAAGRHTTYACPETCPFNPFSAANYDQYGKIEGAADMKFFNWLIEHTPNRDEFDRMISHTLGAEPSSEFFHKLAWHGFYRKNADSRTWVEEWHRQGQAGSSKDEQLVSKCKTQMRPAIVEVLQILDDRRLQVLDLLDPQKTPFVLVDRVLARHAVRFGVHAVHIFPLPHFWRLYGTAYMIPSLPPLGSEEIVAEIIAHLGGGKDPDHQRRWLMEHYSRFEEAVLAVGLARRRGMFENLDAQFGKAIYELARPFDGCRERLGIIPEIADDPLDPSEEAENFLEGRVWFASAGDPELDVVGKGAALGRILLGRTHWRLEVMGGSRLDRLRQRFESLMGDRVRFVAERRDDLAAQMRLKDPDYDTSLVPPALLREPQQIATAVARVPVPAQPQSKESMKADYLFRRDMGFLDNNIPALNCRTPRQAASDPKLRPELIRLMKERIRDCDERNLETGRNDDINWMVRELGLHEILFDPPPPRPRLKLRSDSPEDDEEAEEELDFLDLVPPLALPNRPWTREEARARLEVALGTFPKITQAYDYVAGLNYPLFGDLRQIVGGLLTDREHQFLAPILSLLVLSFAPRGTQPPLLEFDRLNRTFHDEIPLLVESSLKQTDFLREWMDRSSQPALLEIFLSLVATLIERAPASVRPRESVGVIFFVIVRVVMEETDRALRG